MLVVAEASLADTRALPHLTCRAQATFDGLVGQVADATVTALKAGEHVFAQAVDTAAVTDLNERVPGLLQDAGLLQHREVPHARLTQPLVRRSTPCGAPRA